MPIFNVKNNKLISIKEQKIDLERDIQNLTEKNLKTIFGLEFICSEFSLQNLRIDTIAFDEEINSFVVIEYKRDRSFSVIDQGYAYLALMLNNKAEFILEYNEKTFNNLKRGDVDWSQSRVIFIAGGFTVHQKNAINFQDLPMELWEVKKYDNGTVLYNQLKASEKNASIKTVSKDKTIEKVSREVKSYSVEDLFNTGWDDSRHLYETLIDKILDIDNRIEEKINKYYIGYKIGNQNLVALHMFKSKIRMDILRTKPEDLNDPQNKVKLKKDSMKHWNQYISEFDITTSNDIDYAMSLIRQVWEKMYK